MVGVVAAAAVHLAVAADVGDLELELALPVLVVEPTVDVFVGPGFGEPARPGWHRAPVDELVPAWPQSVPVTCQQRSEEPGVQGLRRRPSVQQELVAVVAATLVAAELAFVVPGLQLGLVQPNEPPEDLPCLQFDPLQHSVRLGLLQELLVHVPSGSELALAGQPPELPVQIMGQLSYSSWT